MSPDLSTFQLMGEAHNAKACTFDGRDLWVASVSRRCERKFKLEDVTEHDTYLDALNWVAAYAKNRTLPIAIQTPDRWIVQ